MKNILIVEDNKFGLDAISLNFSSMMPVYSILKAENGRQAIDIIESMPVDFILTDIEMPEVNGYQLVEYVKRNHPSIPILGMSACCTPDVLEMLHALGVSDCVEKPFDFAEVTHMIFEKLELVPVLR